MNGKTQASVWVITSGAVVNAPEFKMCGFLSAAFEVIVRLETVQTMITLKLKTASVTSEGQG